jgi:hypothetical protein
MNNNESSENCDFNGSEKNEFMLALQDTLKTAPPEYVEALAPTFMEIIGLMQLATAGDAKSVGELLKQPGPFLKKLTKFDRKHGDNLMGYLQAKALHEVMTGESKADPTVWAKLMVDIRKEMGKEDDRRKKQRGPAAGDAKEIECELYDELEEEGKELQKKGSGQKDS